jgi:hypothetical protein
LVSGYTLKADGIVAFKTFETRDEALVGLSE